MLTRKNLLVGALSAALLASALLTPTAQAQDAPPSLTIRPLGAYATGQLDAAAAEIVAYHAGTQRAYVVNGGDKTLDILDVSDPTAPALVSQVDMTQFGDAATSVDVFGDLLAVAVPAAEKTDPGAVVFLDPDGAVLAQVAVGALPDMLTFTPDGRYVLTANEGEPNDDYSVDPEGSVSIIDMSGGVAALSDASVRTAGFAAFNDAELDAQIRIYGPNATVAQDLEPEYIAVSPDSTTAFVTLQENNALAVVDLANAEVTTLLPLGFKHFDAPVATLERYEIADRPVLGVTATGQEILLGGFSGLFYEGMDDSGRYIFVTHTDRGPNPEPVDVDNDGVNERPFVLPDFQPVIVRLALDPVVGAVEILEQIGLTRADGMPLTGLPNLAGEPGMAYADEKPVDLQGNPLELDPLGADPEGIVRAEDGAYWLVDEYRPAIYHFGADGVLLARYVPEGSNNEETGVVVGEEALPAIYAQRRANRGFEAVALRDGILYAFIQSPIDNPDSKKDSNSKASTLVRILAFDTNAAQTVGEYFYRLDGDGVDKIGDAVAAPDGSILVMERNDDTGPAARKLVYRINLDAATNFLGYDLPIGVELQSDAGLARLGITPATKTLAVDLGAIGYDMVDKPEGLALIDENTLAVINDDDFGVGGAFDLATGLIEENPNPTPIVLGIVRLAENGLDASDKDGGVNIANWPVQSMYMPDAIAAYTVKDELYLVTANEGDARDYDGYSEEARLGDLVLDSALFPNAAELQREENLGRLRVSTASTDVNGDGLVDRIAAFGGRSFSIWDAAGNLVFDSGDAIERITAGLLPDAFNSSGENDSFDSRSDDKGPEPEALALGEIDGRTYAFIGLERIGGVMVWDITDPRAPIFVQYANNRDFTVATEAAGDLAPEGIVFVPAADSPTGAPLLLVANEFSGTTTVWEIGE
ncbi:MAG TPA: calcium-binding protein [Chloroflexi bacterium]|nr:calcium-binding protein [Chloroflexota bacterium]